MTAPPPFAETSLRERLIAAGLALLAEGGAEGLTLRRAAARAGVSHAAPAHHFDGLAGLQTAIAERAFARFTEAMLRHRDAAPDQPFARLLAICEGYLEFAETQGGLFHVMFNCADVRRDDPAVWRESARAYQVLREGCLPFSSFEPDPVLEAAVWSAVHGYAMLGFSRQHGQAGGEDPPPFLAVLARVLMRP